MTHPPIGNPSAKINRVILAGISLYHSMKQGEFGLLRAVSSPGLNSRLLDQDSFKGGEGGPRSHCRGLWMTRVKYGVKLS